jgi:hypothetical protein
LRAAADGIHANRRHWLDWTTPRHVGAVVLGGLAVGVEGGEDEVAGPAAGDDVLGDARAGVADAGGEPVAEGGVQAGG